MRHGPASTAVDVMLRDLRKYCMAQAVDSLVEQGSPAFNAAVPILSQFLKAEMAEHEVRSIASGAISKRTEHRRKIKNSIAIDGITTGPSRISRVGEQQCHDLRPRKPWSCLCYERHGAADRRGRERCTRIRGQRSVGPGCCDVHAQCREIGDGSSPVAGSISTCERLSPRAVASRNND